MYVCMYALLTHFTSAVLGCFMCGCSTMGRGPLGALQDGAVCRSVPVRSEWAGPCMRLSARLTIIAAVAVRGCPHPTRTILPLSRIMFIRVLLLPPILVAATNDVIWGDDQESMSDVLFSCINGRTSYYIIGEVQC